MYFDFENEKQFIQSFNRIEDAIGGGLITPSVATTMSKKIFVQPFKGLTFMETGIVTNNEGGDSDFIESLRVTGYGSFASQKGRGNISGKIGVKGDVELMPSDERTAESDYGITEQRQLSGHLNIANRLRKATVQIYMDDIDKVGYLGDKVLNNKGLINADWEVKEKAGKDWRDMTNKEVSDHIRDLIILQNETVGTRELHANKGVVPSGLYTRLASSDYKDYSDRTILSKIENDLKVKLIPSFRAEKVSDFGDSDTMVVFNDSEDSLLFRLPRLLKFTPVERRLMRMVFASSYRIAGLDVINPSGARLEFRA